VRAAAVLALLLWSHVAAAVEGESSLRLGPGYGALSLIQAQDKTVSAQGGTLHLDYRRAINDTMWFRASLGGGLYATDAGELGHSAMAVVGITYAVDILRYVPYVDGGVGLMLVGGGEIDGSVKAIVELGGGLDVIESPRWSWGVEVHLASFASQTIFFTVGPHLTFRWGYF
jgi:hypothetical protein